MDTERTFQERLYKRTILDNPWMIQNPHRPLVNKRQALFLGYNGREALFGGSVGGGKSSALLMAAAQYVEFPGYSALIIRRSFRDAEQADALIPRSKEWWGGRQVNGQEARWSEVNKRWTFPSGATITFGYMDKAGDETQYQSAAFQFVAFDELTQFRESQYRYMFSRLRRPTHGPLARVPIRIRAASNPGGRGAAWVKRRFIPPHGTRFFVPSFLRDNPYLDAEDYVRGMAHMTPEQRKQLLAGSWGEFEGGRFKREWFYHGDGMDIAHPWWTEHGPDGAIYVCVQRGDEIRKFNAMLCWQFVMCDPAASDKDTADYTAIGAFMVTPDRDLLVLDVIREQLDIDAIVPRLAEVCKAYQPAWVGIEAIAFQVAILRQAQRHPDIPACRAFEPEGKGKLVRATPAIIRAANGQIYLPQAGCDYHPWVEDFVSELCAFTGLESAASIKAAEQEGHAAGDAYDDQVDMLAYAVQGLERFGLAGGPVVVNAARELIEAAESWDRMRNGYSYRER
jgi:predicted phage terminase large subunit-like protein